jgi:hypothetical protein
MGSPRPQSSQMWLGIWRHARSRPGFGQSAAVGQDFVFPRQSPGQIEGNWRIVEPHFTFLLQGLGKIVEYRPALERCFTFLGNVLFGFALTSRAELGNQ